jgi:hypothetical protein
MRTWIVALALVAMPAALSAQEDPDARIQAALTAAARAEIPVALLESKVQEGRAKGVPAARIAAAVEARLESLVRARAALDRAGTRVTEAGDLAIAADALQAGVSESAMVDVMTRVPGERRAVATAVLTELVEMGIASEVALARVHDALARGGEALVNLPGRMSEGARDRGRGRRPDRVGPPAEVDAGVRGGVGVGRGRGNNPHDD